MTNLPFGFESPDDSPGFLLWQTTMVWQRLIKKALEPYDISHAQFVIMAILLWHRGKNLDVTQINIIAMSKLDKMTVSKSLKKLVSMKLVERWENMSDSRAKSVQLTNLGCEMANKLVPIVEGVDANFFSRIEGQDDQNLIAILRKLANLV